MNSTRMRLRSHVLPTERDVEQNEKEIKKVDVEKLPFIKFVGKVKYYTTLIDCAVTCENILTKVQQSENLFIIGFDLEWPFNFQTGPGKTAVIQLSPSLDETYIFHVTHIKNLPKSLTELIAHPNTRLAGVNIKNDVRKLARDFTGVDVDKVINNCVDAGYQANIVLNCQRRWSMEKLVHEFFQMRINKDKKVRNSKWHIIPLSEAQQRYAALDAYASLKLYLHLEQLKDESMVKENMSVVSNT